MEDVTEMKTVVDALNEKAVNADDSTDALKWSQAALNAANSYCSLAALKWTGP